MKALRRAFLAPEVVQTSAMDCGPAALKCLLQGFGIEASYGRLREACQTDLDGTSINTLEVVAGELGLNAEQVVIPADHLLLPAAEALPALVVVRQPNGLTHFVVVWRVVGAWVQVMDPAVGRRWMTRRQLVEQLYLHRMKVDAAAWRQWAGSEDFLRPLMARLGELGFSPREASELVAAAAADPGWETLARLDAATRMTRTLLASGGAKRGPEARRMFGLLNARSNPPHGDGELTLPESFWQVRPVAAVEAAPQQLRLAGVVLLRVRGRNTPQPTSTLSADLRATVTEGESRGGRALFELCRQAGRLPPAVLALMVVTASLSVVLEALLFRGFLDLGSKLGLPEQRLAAVALLLLFVAALLWLDLPIAGGALRLGRQLEARLRLAFLRKLPRLSDRYFASRLTSDMAERCHNVHRVRKGADLAESMLRGGSEFAATLAGLVWLDPHLWRWVLVAVGLVVGLPTALLPWLKERDLRLRTHNGALARFYLDALQGLFPIRTHGAQRTLARQHEGLLVEWSRTHQLLRSGETLVDALVQVAMLVVIVGMVFDHVRRQGLDGSLLLLFFWAFNAMSLGHMLTLILATQVPALTNVVARLVEPLGAPEENDFTNVEAPAGSARAVALALSGVEVKAAGHNILEAIDLNVAAGDQVAIIGPSGAGKSSLVGLLLGWHRASAGRISVDGRELDGPTLATLRQTTAWVDPAVQLWNRGLLDNLMYGNTAGQTPAMDAVVEQAELVSVLRQLPRGFATPLGEGGGLISGGEGQRVRFARALLKRGVRLVILDEPFRGLDRRQRNELLARARVWWQGATLLCITHDVSETLSFPRVVVVEAGRIVEQGSPPELAADPKSRYAQLLAAEQRARADFWARPLWRRLRLDGGRLSEEGVS